MADFLIGSLMTLTAWGLLWMISVILQDAFEVFRAARRRLKRAYWRWRVRRAWVRFMAGIDELSGTMRQLTESAQSATESMDGLGAVMMDAKRRGLLPDDA